MKKDALGMANMALGAGMTGVHLYMGFRPDKSRDQKDAKK